MQVLGLKTYNNKTKKKRAGFEPGALLSFI